MKKQYLKNLIVLIIVAIFLAPVLRLKADSGWDSGYDSGWDSGSDSGWSSGSDRRSSRNSGHSGSSKSSEDFEWFSYFIMGSGALAIIVAIIVGINEIRYENKKNKSRLMITKPSVSDEELAKYNLNRVDVLQKTFEIYRNVQVAWMNFDFDTLRKYLSDELFNSYKMQLNALKLINI